MIQYWCSEYNWSVENRHIMIAVNHSSIVVMIEQKLTTVGQRIKKVERFNHDMFIVNDWFIIGLNEDDIEPFQREISRNMRWLWYSKDAFVP